MTANPKPPTAEERAEKYCLKFNNHLTRKSCENGFLAGRADFVENELRALKEKLFLAAQVQFNQKHVWVEPIESAPYILWKQVEYIFDEFIEKAKTNLA